MNAAQYAIVRESYDSYKQLTQKIKDAVVDERVPLSKTMFIYGIEECEDVEEESEESQ